jgi:ribose transport system substrate-binding protein
MNVWKRGAPQVFRACAFGAVSAFIGFAGVTASKAADPSQEEQAKTLAAVPTDAQKYYGGYWYAGNVVANPFSDWKPHPPPWQICHNDSYLGNSWRANLVAELKALTKQLADQGLAKPDLIVTNSNGDINLELSQLKAQVAQGCDIIMSYPGSATGLCSGIKDAYNKGVLFVAIDSPVTCPEGLNVATNPYYRGQFGGDWIAKKLNGKGNVIVMNGQPGTANTVAQETGLRQAVASDPGIKVVGSLYGMWTGSVAKSEVLKFLATHPEPVAAVFSTGNMGVGVGQAFEQSGRPIPIITEVTNLCSLLAYWKEKNLTAYTFVQDGGPMAYSAFIPALHMMAGQRPKVSTIFMPLPIITSENFNDYYEPSMTVQSTCFANGKDLHLVPDEYFDQFFTGGQPRAQVKIVPTN